MALGSGEAAERVADGEPSFDHETVVHVLAQKCLAAAEQGGGVEVRDRRTRVLFSDIDLEGRPTWLDFTPSGDLLVAMEGGVLAVYDADTFEKEIGAELIQAAEKSNQG